MTLKYMFGLGAFSSTNLNSGQSFPIIRAVSTSYDGTQYVALKAVRSTVNIYENISYAENSARYTVMVIDQSISESDLN